MEFNSHLKPFHHIIFVALIVIITVPFLNKALHIDDPLFVYEAEQILKDPMHPYDFRINWLGLNLDAVYSIPNPPLVSYGFAITKLLFGSSEKALHGFLIIFIILAIYSTYFLSTRFTSNPFPATLFLIVSPAFVVNSSTLMVDFPAMALALTATAFFIYGLDHNHNAAKILGGIFLGAACLTKYWTVIYFFILLFYALQRNQFRESIVPLGIGTLISGGWMLFTLQTSGFFHPLVGRDLVASLEISMLRKVVSLLSFCGVSLFMIGCFKIDKLSDKLILLLAIALAGIGAWNVQKFGMGAAILFFVLMTNGIFLLCRVLATWFNPQRLKNPDTLFLLVWLSFALAFVIKGTHFNAMRFVIIFLPPLILLMFHLGKETKRFNQFASLNLGLTLLLALSISFADTQFANLYRDASKNLVQEIRTLESQDSASDKNGQIWFFTHWGFQYYMDAQGGRNFNFENAHELKKGDWIINTLNAHKNFFPPQINKFLRKEKEITINGAWPIKTMNRSLGAGWYSDIWGLFRLRSTKRLHWKFLLFYESTLAAFQI